MAEIGGKLGEGTFSEVLRVRNKKNGKTYAMKRFRKHFNSVEEIESLREIQALRRLNHNPNIIQLEEVIFDAKYGILSLAFEIMDSNLYEVLSRKGHPPVHEHRAKWIMWQITKALDFVHSKGIFHRDIKPENILVRGDVHSVPVPFPNTNPSSPYHLLSSFPIVKLADFGSCRGIHSKMPYTEYIATRWYRSPECLLFDGIYTYKMDVWGIGCVFFELVTKVPLFPGDDELDQLHKIHHVMGTPSEKLMKSMVASGQNQLVNGVVNAGKENAAKNTNADGKALKGIFKKQYAFPPTKGTGFRAAFPPHILYGAQKVNASGKHGSNGGSGYSSADYPGLSDECVNLMEQLLLYDPDVRPSARHALKHPWLKECRDAEANEKQRLQPSTTATSSTTDKTAATTVTAANNSSQAAVATSAKQQPPANPPTVTGKESNAAATLPATTLDKINARKRNKEEAAAQAAADTKAAASYAVTSTNKKKVNEESQSLLGKAIQALSIGAGPTSNKQPAQAPQDANQLSPLISSKSSVPPLARNNSNLVTGVTNSAKAVVPPANPTLSSVPSFAIGKAGTVLLDSHGKPIDLAATLARAGPKASNNANANAPNNAPSQAAPNKSPVKQQVGGHFPPQPTKRLPAPQQPSLSGFTITNTLPSLTKEKLPSIQNADHAPSVPPALKLNTTKPLPPVHASPTKDQPPASSVSADFSTPLGFSSPVAPIGFASPISPPNDAILVLKPREAAALQANTSTEMVADTRRKEANPPSDIASPVYADTFSSLPSPTAPALKESSEASPVSVVAQDSTEPRLAAPLPADIATATATTILESTSQQQPSPEQQPRQEAEEGNTNEKAGEAGKTAQEHVA